MGTSYAVIAGGSYGGKKQRISNRHTKVGFEDINERLLGTIPSYIDHTRQLNPRALHIYTSFRYHLRVGVCDLLSFLIAYLLNMHFSHHAVRWPFDHLRC